MFGIWIFESQISQMTQMKTISRNYRDGLLDDLSHSKAAAAYLHAALEENSREAFLLALRDVADARGIAKLSEKTALNRESIYRMLSKRGNPQLSSLVPLLETLGLSINIKVRRQAMAA